MKINYPVIFFVFKRPATTREFLELMKDAGIKKIYIFADGPRNVIEKRETDKVKVNIDEFQSAHKDIELITSYSHKNIGLKRNIVDGLTKVFSNESAAIIIEDDCLPTLDFFRFTNDMLLKYQDDQMVMSVNGTSTGGDFEHSYDFSQYPQCWGWATWARSWQLYDANLSSFDSDSWTKLSHKRGFSPLLSWYWQTMLTMVKVGWINTWDFQWSFTHFLYHGLSIAPSVNLIKNIGFDGAATNTKTKTRVADIKTTLLSWPLNHPSKIMENQSVSRRAVKDFYLNPVAILGMLRQYIYWKWSIYAHRH